MTKLKFKVMGSPRLWIGDEEITREMSKKALALLIYIVFAPDQCVAREQIMALLWSESDEKAARYNLRHNLWKIRRVMRINDLEDDWLEADNQFVRIVNKDILEVDAFQLIHLHQKGIDQEWCFTEHQVKQLVTLYKQHFFDHFYLTDCEDFNDWLYFKREEFQRLYIQCLNESAKVYETEQQLDIAIDLYKELTNFMPYDDEVHLSLVRNLYETGDYFNALRYYEQHRKKLRMDLNVNPSTALQTFVEQIQNKKQEDPERKKSWDSRIVVENHAFADVPYMTLSHIIDVILEHYKASELLEFDSYDWSDLSRINGNIRKIVEIDPIHEAHLTESSERIRVFKAMYNLLNYLHKHHDLVLDFKHLSQLDPQSDEFFNSLFKTDQGAIMKNWL